MLGSKLLLDGLIVFVGFLFICVLSFSEVLSIFLPTLPPIFPALAVNSLSYFSPNAESDLQLFTNLLIKQSRVIASLQ